MVSGLGNTGDTLRPNKGHVKSASVSSSGPETATDPLRSRYVGVVLCHGRVFFLLFLSRFLWVCNECLIVNYFAWNSNINKISLFIQEISHIHITLEETEFIITPVNNTTLLKTVVAKKSKIISYFIYLICWFLECLLLYLFLALFLNWCTRWMSFMHFIFFLFLLAVTRTLPLQPSPEHKLSPGTRPRVALSTQDKRDPKLRTPRVLQGTRLTPREHRSSLKLAPNFRKG